ncbi:MAG: 4Fe-4S double cluster binding domain-containing protein [Spirochaetota bacterium]
MEETLELLTRGVGKHNAQFRIVSINHLEELKDEIWALIADRLISEDFFNKNLGHFKFTKPEELPNTKSIIIFAFPQKITEIKFSLHGTNHAAIIPPTYIYNDVIKACETILKSLVTESGKGFLRAALPLKLLAVRSGLGKYGRNNLCYVEGMGSFTRLQAYYTDYHFETDNWQETEMMDRCADCKLCITNCPTGSITFERTLINAERCLTLYNENEGTFPEWITPHSHNALVGCMQCQSICPLNRSLKEKMEIQEHFNEGETDMILHRVPFDELPETSQRKLKNLNIDEYYIVLPRNMGVLFQGK